MSIWRDDLGVFRFQWLIVGIVVVSIGFGLLFGLVRVNQGCADTVPAYDGRCWGERDLVVEQGAVVCRCRRAP